MLVSIARIFVNKFPKNKFFDFFYHLIYFFWAHRRFPSKSSWLFNDHLFFIKVSGELDCFLRQVTSDKYLVKGYASYVLKEDLTPDTYHVIYSKEELHEFSPPCDCVLKPAHLSGIVIFKRAGEKLADHEILVLKDALNSNQYSITRELNYKYLTPSIIVEEALTLSGFPLDYKLFCCNGDPRIIAVFSSREKNLRVNFYDMTWKKINVGYSLPALTKNVEKPLNFKKMIKVAKVLSRKFSLIRVDFYEVDGQLFLGEITHVHAQGHARFESLEDEVVFSQALFSRD